MAIDIRALENFFRNYQKHLEEFSLALSDNVDPFPQWQKNILQIYKKNVDKTIARFEKLTTARYANSADSPVQDLVDQKLVQFIARAKKALQQQESLLRLKNLLALQNQNFYFWPLRPFLVEIEKLLGELKNIIPLEFDSLGAPTKEWLDNTWQEVQSLSSIKIAQNVLQLRQSTGEAQTQARRTLLFQLSLPKVEKITNTSFGEINQHKLDPTSVKNLTHEVIQNLQRAKL